MRELSALIARHCWRSKKSRNSLFRRAGQSIPQQRVSRPRRRRQFVCFIVPMRTQTKRAPTKGPFSVTSSADLIDARYRYVAALSLNDPGLPANVGGPLYDHCCHAVWRRYDELSLHSHDAQRPWRVHLLTSESPSTGRVRHPNNARDLREFPPLASFTPSIHESPPNRALCAREARLEY